MIHDKTSSEEQPLSEAPKTPAGPLTWIFRILSAAAAIFVFTILIFSVVIPAALGWVPLTIATGSMEPTYPVGSMVIGEPVTEDEAKSLMTNDVITFMPYPDNPTLVTHRIVASSVDTTGKVFYTTKGDANNAEDPDMVADHQVRAVVKYHIPYLGYVANWLDGGQKQTIVYGIVAVLSLYCVYQVGVGVRERRKNV